MKKLSYIDAGVKAQVNTDLLKGRYSNVSASAGVKSNDIIYTSYTISSDIIKPTVGAYGNIPATTGVKSNDIIYTSYTISSDIIKPTVGAYGNIPATTGVKSTDVKAGYALAIDNFIKLLLYKPKTIEPVSPLTVFNFNADTVKPQPLRSFTPLPYKLHYRDMALLVPYAEQDSYYGVYISEILNAIKSNKLDTARSLISDYKRMIEERPIPAFLPFTRFTPYSINNMTMPSSK